MLRRPPRSPPFPDPTLSRAARLAELRRLAERERKAAQAALPELERLDRLGMPVLQRTGRIELAGAVDVLRLLRRQPADRLLDVDRKSTRLNSSHANISYAVF